MVIGDRQIKRGHAEGGELIGRHPKRDDGEIGGRELRPQIVDAKHDFKRRTHRLDLARELPRIAETRPDDKAHPERRRDPGQGAGGETRQVEGIAPAHADDHRREFGVARRGHRRQACGIKTEERPFPSDAHDSVRSVP